MIRFVLCDVRQIRARSSEKPLVLHWFVNQEMLRTTVLCDKWIINFSLSATCDDKRILCKQLKHVLPRMVVYFQRDSL